MEEKTSLTITIKGVYVDNDGTAREVNETLENKSGIFLNTFDHVNENRTEHDIVTIGRIYNMDWCKTIVAIANELADIKEGYDYFLAVLNQAMAYLAEAAAGKSVSADAFEE